MFSLSNATIPGKLFDPTATEFRYIEEDRLANRITTKSNDLTAFFSIIQLLRKFKKATQIKDTQTFNKLYGYLEFYLKQR